MSYFSYSRIQPHPTKCKENGNMSRRQFYRRQSFKSLFHFDKLVDHEFHIVDGSAGSLIDFHCHRQCVSAVADCRFVLQFGRIILVRRRRCISTMADHVSQCVLCSFRLLISLIDFPGLGIVVLASSYSFRRSMGNVVFACSLM